MCGAASTKAMMITLGTPARRISRAIGKTPSEQTGNRVPTAQARNKPFQPRPPNSLRVPSAPSIRRITPATSRPHRMVVEASMAICVQRSSVPQKIVLIMVKFSD